MCVCVCVCVFFPFILDIKLVGRTSRGHTGGRSHRISRPPSFCGACLDLHVYIIVALPDYSSEVIERHQKLFYGRLIDLALEFDIH